MARDYAALYTTVWTDRDWRSLTVAQQHGYWLLLTQPKVSPCGVLDFIPGRLANLAADMSRGRIESVVDDLCKTQPRPYLVLDGETYELLLRSFVRWDSLIKSERPAKAIAKDWDAISSDTIRQAVLDELRAHRRALPDLKGWLGIKDQNPDLMRLIEDPAKTLLKAV